MSIPFKYHPKDVQDLIRVRIKQCGNDPDSYKDTDSVRMMFMWMKTPEGHKFWQSIDNGDYSVMKTLPNATDPIYPGRPDAC